MTVIPFTQPARARPSPVAGSRPALLLVTLALLALLPRLGFLARPFESDAGLYVYMGKSLLEGQTPYLDFYETKPPGVPLVMAGLYATFGDHWWPYVALQTAMTVAAASLLGRGVRPHAGDDGARAAFWFALTYLNLAPVAYRGFQLETVQACLAAAAGYFVLRSITTPRPRDLFIAGALAGLAAALKPTGAAVAGAALLTLLHPRPRAIPPLLAGLLGAPALVALWTWRVGLLPEMPALFREISLYGSQTPLVSLDWFKLLTVALVAATPFLVGRTFRGAVHRPAPQPALVFAIAWLALECLGVLVQRRLYAYHFLVLAPPLAILFGLAWRDPRRATVTAALAPILALSIACTIPDLRTLIEGVRDLPESEYLRAHAAPGDTVVGDRIERLLIETRLHCGARYAHLFYFVNHDAAPLEYAARFLDDLDQNRPAWAVFDTRRDELHRRFCEEMPMLAERPLRRQNFLTAWRAIDDYLERHYRPVATLNDKTIFRRRPADPTPAATASAAPRSSPPSPRPPGA